jgi:hypothetical protein
MKEIAEVGLRKNAELVVIFLCGSQFWIVLPPILLSSKNVCMDLFLFRGNVGVFVLLDSICKWLPGYGSRLGSPWVVA